MEATTKPNLLRLCLIDALDDWIWPSNDAQVEYTNEIEREVLQRHDDKSD
jgi:hypothetical protein